MAEIHILSYFSVEADLAGEMRAWPEFRRGAGYDVELVGSDSATVAISVVSPADEHAYVRVVGSSACELFDRAVGRVVHALAAYSDHLMVTRIS
jgi:hypothetical protein